MPKPILLSVDDDSDVLRAIERDLRSQYGADYRVIGSSLGLGSRHIAAANMSAVINSIAIVVSESAVVRLFCHGKLVGEIIPELWMIDRIAQIRGPLKKETFGELTVLTPSGRRAITAR